MSWEGKGEKMIEFLEFCRANLLKVVILLSIDASIGGILLFVIAIIFIKDDTIENEELAKILKNIDRENRKEKGGKND